MTENSFAVKTFLIHIAIGIAAGLLETLTAHFCQPIIPLYMDSIWNAASSFYSLASGVTCGVVFQIEVVLLGFSKPSSLVFTICSLTITLTMRLFMRCCPRLLNLTQKILGVLFLIIALTFLISIEGGLLYILIVVICLVFLVPFIANRASKTADKTMKMSYMNGINTGTNTQFVDALGNPKQLELANSYFVNAAGIRRWMAPCQMIALVVLIVMMSIVLGGVV